MPCTGVRRLCSALALGLSGLAQVAGQDQWAILIAGSKSYFNYRHQADVCHAYKVLTERGFDPEKIITMIYDDVANSTLNPFPGRLYNRPAKSADDAVDVYAGCKMDYTGASITPDRFLAVLSGNASYAGGKVLKSTSRDHVFVNFVDHGGVGLIAFPSMGQVLHAKRLIETLKSMHEKGMYEKLVFYLETCESGSMFEGLVPPELPVYAVTAANAKESSWGTYCGDDAQIGNKSLNTCLGDLFEVSWMSDSEKRGAAQAKELLSEQFARVKKATNKSHVMRYGQVQAIGSLPISDFQGPGMATRAVALRGAKEAEEAPARSSSVRSRDVKLHLLSRDYEASGSEEAAQRLVAEIRDREAAKALGQAIARGLLGGSGQEAQTLLRAPLLDSDNFAWTLALANCHELATEAFGSKCGWTENRLPLSNVLFQLCEHTEGDAEPVLKSLEVACGEELERQGRTSLVI